MNGSSRVTAQRYAAGLIFCLMSSGLQGLEIAGIEVIDLGTLPGDSESAARDINDEGEIVGYSRLGSDGERSAFIYRDEAMERLAKPAGTEGAWAAAINNDGVVVGSAKADGHVSRGVVWRGSLVATLPPDSRFGDWTAANDINNEGQVVGIISSRTVIWDSPIARPRSYRQIRDQALDGGPHALTGAAINDRGDVAGIHDRRDTAFLYSSGLVHRLHPGEFADNAGYGINQQSAVVGIVTLESSETTERRRRAALWLDKDSDYVELGTLGGLNSVASDINEMNIVVGSSEVTEETSSAFIWHEDFGLQALPGLGGARSSASSINVLGHVVGASQTADGEWHATLWVITYNPRIVIPVFSFENLVCMPFINCASPLLSLLVGLILSSVAIGAVIMIRRRHR